ncbi:MAG TPA: hypothetical protein VF426_04675 [Marmoricola sp.]
MTTSEQLLDAQVAWLIEELTGDALSERVAADVDALLAIGARTTTATVVDAESVNALLHDVLETVPASAGATTLVETAADVAYDGPAETYTLAEVIDRENVERLTDEVLGGADLLEKVLDDLTRSQLVATIATRFMGRIVNDVVQTNRAMAEKIPGVGSLVSLGAKSAGKVLGAADKQLEAVLGDTAAKGAAFAMRRLNKIVIETIKDPTTRDAVLEIFDLYADEPVPHLNRVAEPDDVRRVAGLLQDIVIAGAPTPPVLALVDALIDGFFRVYGDEPVATLLADLDLDRDLLVRHADALATKVLRGAHGAGELEPLLRDRLAPFFASPEVAALLNQ